MQIEPAQMRFNKTKITTYLQVVQLFYNSMEKIHLVGAEGIDPKRIEQLEEDINHLLANTYRRKGMAQKMGKHAGNFSKVVTGKLSVSHAFIEDFYRIFGDELLNESTVKEDLGEYHPSPRTLMQTIHAIKRDTEAIRLHLNIKDDGPATPSDKKEN